MTTTNPLSKAIQQAESATNYLGVLFAKTGNSEHPRGFVPTAYRNARRAMKTALTERNRLTAAQEVTRELRSTIQANVNQVLTKSVSYGMEYARKQLAAYGLNANQADASALSSQLLSGSAAVSAVIDKQAQAVQSMLTVGMDVDLILGDEDHIGLLRPGEVISSANFWEAGLLWLAFEWLVMYSLDGDPMKSKIQKIAVAAIDPRTTNCCLMVHGQIQPFNRPFELHGTPRYADKLDWSPFHDHCRTSVALYLDIFDDGLPEEMRNSASALLGKR